jgi:hypothetical protein
MKTIGSKQAAILARGKFGKAAYVGRSGASFYVGVLRLKAGAYYLKHILGVGSSWERALVAAGVKIPEKLAVEMVDKTPPTKEIPFPTDMPEMDLEEQNAAQ